MSCGCGVEFSQKLNSLLPTREFDLDVPDTVDLSAVGVVVNFVWRSKGSTDRNVIAMTITDPETATVTVDLTAPAVAAIGMYQYQFEIVIGGKTLVIPEDGFYVYQVTATI